MSSRGHRDGSVLRGDDGAELGAGVDVKLKGSNCGVFAAELRTEGLRTRFARRKVKKAAEYESQ